MVAIRLRIWCRILCGENASVAWIGSLLGAEETRHEQAKVELDKLDGKKYELVAAMLAEELPKPPTIRQVEARLAQDPELVAAKRKVAEIKGNTKKLSTLFTIYDRRFNMIQTRGAMMRKEHENVKNGI